VIALVLGWLGTWGYFITRSAIKEGSFCPLFLRPIKRGFCVTRPTTFKEAVELLKIRKDKEALAIFEQLLKKNPEDIEALCGKAEVLRRDRKYDQAQALLEEILKKDPNYISAMLSLSYTLYQKENFDRAQKLVNRIMQNGCETKEDEALANMLLGAINSKRAAKGWLLTKLKYGPKIQCYFLKAKELGPELPEVRLGLGTFYLLAPKVIGGDVNKAIPELEYTVRIAPDFATANARLAHAYKMKGDMEKYKEYMQRAKELDPENEAVKEIESEER
jgi:tetratricopeptide (TPR) repeat protein